jgi:MFS family permease
VTSSYAGGVEAHAPSRNAAPAYPRQTARLYLDLSVFWFALSFLWAGMLTIVVQRLIEQMARRQKDLYLGWTLGLGALVATIVVIIVGTISDRSRWRMGRRRPYIIVGAALSVPPLLWLAAIGSVPLVIADYCLIQFWVNVATSPYQALIPDLVPRDHQGTASAHMGITSLLGQLAGFVVCGLLITRPGGLWMVVIVYAALILALALYTAWRIPERSAADNPAPRVSVAQAAIESFRVSPRAHPDFFRLIGSRFIINMGFYTATQFLLYYVSDTLRAPRPVDLLAEILVISTVAGLIGTFPAGKLSDRMSKKAVVYVSAGVTAAAALIFVLTSSTAVALAAAFVFGAGLGAFMAVDWAFATNLLPQRDEAKHMGIWHVAFTVPQVIAPVIGGVVAYLFNQHFGHGFGYRAVLSLVIVYFAIGAAMITPIKERVPRP